MSSYRIELFAEQDQISAADVIQLWMTESELDLQEAERRVAEILLIATARGGELAAVLTTYLARHEQLRAVLWHFRVFVASAHRQSGLAIELARAARDHLGERYTSGTDRRGIGLLYEAESEILKRFIRDAVSPNTQFVFIGETALGAHVRVFYFPGALAPEPDGSPPPSGQGSA